jgi:ribosomal-protein-alanine N-acetyltransferase
MRIPFFSPPPAPHVGPLRMADAEAVAGIHAEAFAHGWSAADIEQMLNDPAVMADALRSGNRLVGFVLSRCAADEAEILTIAVAKSSRGHGFSRLLLSRHIARLAGRGVTALFLDVEETNAAARALYDRLDFAAVGRREAYYARADGSRGHALVLRRAL